MTAFRDHAVQMEGEEYGELKALSEALELDSDRATLSLLTRDGRKVKIPRAVLGLLRDAVEALKDGGAVSLMPYHSELTTQESADYLGVSRPYLVALLERENIPHHKVGTHRRIRLNDIEAYRQRRDEARRAALDDLTREAYTMGFYDVDHPDEGQARRCS